MRLKENVELEPGCTYIVISTCYIVCCLALRVFFFYRPSASAGSRSVAAQQAMARKIDLLHSEAWPDCVYWCCLSVITCTARYGSVIVQWGMARLCVPVLALDHHFFEKILASQPKCLTKSLALHQKSLNKCLFLYPKCLDKSLILHPTFWTKVLLCTQKYWTQVLLCTQNVQRII